MSLRGYGHPRADDDVPVTRTCWSQEGWPTILRSEPGKMWLRVARRQVSPARGGVSDAAPWLEEVPLPASNRPRTGQFDDLGVVGCYQDDGGGAGDGVPVGGAESLTCRLVVVAALG